MSEKVGFDLHLGFDISPEEMNLSPGEFWFGSLRNVVDIKGSLGKLGKLVFSNLRVIWYDESSKQYNISVGLGLITTISVKETKLDGNTSKFKLHLRVLSNNQRYEFLFESERVQQNPFDNLNVIHRAYEVSMDYRNVKIRGMIMKGDSLILLDQEKIIHQHTNIWNLAKQDEKLGKFYFTNIRVIWVSNVNPKFNISIPYVQMAQIKQQDSKFGPVLYIKTKRNSGGYVIGFKCENLDEIYGQVDSLYGSFSNSPNMGIPKDLLEGYAVEEVDVEEDLFADTEIVESAYNENQNLRALYAVDDKTDRHIVFNEEIGVSMEALPEGLSVKQLWQILKF